MSSVQRTAGVNGTFTYTVTATPYSAPALTIYSDAGRTTVAVASADLVATSNPAAFTASYPSTLAAGTYYLSFSTVFTNGQAAVVDQDDTLVLVTAGGGVTDSLVNAYATLAQARADQAFKDATDTSDDSLITLALNAASRQIDGFCDRRFWQDSSVVARTYDAESPVCVYTDDISTTTGLVVKVDADLTGTFETTLTVNTDYVVLPRNAALEVPARPFTEIRLLPTASVLFPSPNYALAGVEVTAKYGWAAVPDDVTKACLIQAAQLYKAKDAAFGALTLGVEGQAMYVKATLNPIAKALLAPYAKPSVG